MIFKNKKAFTLVELIIVIIILAIISTIATISYIWYSKSAKNSVRKLDIDTVKKSLSLYYIKVNKYPNPDNYVDFTHEWILLWKQWIIWEKVIRQLNSVNKVPLDPEYENNYTYSVNYDNSKYQIWYMVSK